jgi:hypothetical protein
MTAVEVRVDERLRLAGCLLAAGDWPEREQRLKPYRPHRLAESARRALAAHQAHPAVAAAQALDPTQLFSHALADDWPAFMTRDVADFAARTDVVAFQAETQAEWQAARSDLDSVLGRGDLGGFLAALFGGPDHAWVVHPQLLYPGRQSVLVKRPGQWVLSQPPPAAWGASPPWRYGERPDEVLAAVAEELARPLFEQAQAPEPGALAAAAAVLFLRQAEGAEAADQFMLMEQRARKLPQLPRLVDTLEKRKIFNREDREERQGEKDNGD